MIWTATQTREGTPIWTAPLHQLALQVTQGPYGFTMTLHHAHGVILGSVHPGPLEAAKAEIIQLTTSWLTRELEALQRPATATTVVK